MEEVLPVEVSCVSLSKFNNFLVSGISCLLLDKPLTRPFLQAPEVPSGSKGNHMKKKLYVGNLSFETTEAELKELFSRTGQVETVRIITDRDTGRSKGFGFVEMDSSDQAQAAITALNGRALTVNEARPMADRDSGRSGRFKQY